MRNLSRIIFINSANIPYSDNIYLDGNIHFIGTQGVGKSTILRAILFFYNADTQKLGIPVEKQNYTDYYFPFANSYIIYEVTTEHGAFCILSFKAMNRVCYRFIDSPYRKEFFIDENRTAPTAAQTVSVPCSTNMKWSIRASFIPTTSIVISYMAMQRVLNSDVIP